MWPKIFAPVLRSSTELLSGVPVTSQTLRAWISQMPCTVFVCHWPTVCTSSTTSRWIVRVATCATEVVGVQISTSAAWTSAAFALPPDACMLRTLSDGAYLRISSIHWPSSAVGASTSVTPHVFAFDGTWACGLPSEADGSEVLESLAAGRLPPSGLARMRLITHIVLPMPTSDAR